MNASTTTYGTYHRAAAVLATFNPSTLHPVGIPVDPEGELDELLADSFPAPMVGNDRWQLDHRVRRAVLRQMGTAEMQDVLSANPAPTGDLVQEIMAAAIAERLPPLDSLTIAQLAALSQVAEWLTGTTPGLPDRSEIQRRYEQLTLLEPFERLAGEHFRGRSQELAILRSFVGVLDPHTSRPRNRAQPAPTELGEKPAMVIFGPGGLGKSALVARFIWEHASLPEADKFPWVYLDLDRPVLQAESPLTLLVEAIRQLGLQYPAARDATDRIRIEWQKRLERMPATSEMSQRSEWKSLLDDFRNLLENLRITGDPLLFVLDTFEQAQARSERVVTELFAFLRRLQEAVPRLRLLFAGRAPLPDKPLLKEDPDWTLNQLALQPFGREEAQGFLESQGLPSTAAADVAKQVTGTPLALVLAAELWRMMLAAGEQGPLLGGVENDFFGFTLRENEIEGILFGRILRRVRDEDVRAIAYPGLVLRRITPDIIRNVLAVHCNVSLPTPSRADELYEAMRAEVQLVEERDGALRHRPELRRIMLRLMREAGDDARQRMVAIENTAVGYYSKQQGADARAEEIYHRLSLRQPETMLNNAWKRGSVNIKYLFEALEELSPRERAWLKSHLPGHSLTPEERAAADLDSWQLEVEAQTKELLAAEKPLEALALLAERQFESGARYQGSSPLYAIEVQVLEKLSRWREALEAAKDGLAVASATSDPNLGLDLHLYRIRIASRLGDSASVHESARFARFLAERMREKPTSTLIRTEAVYADALRYMGDPALRGVLQSLKQHFATMPDSETEGGPGPLLAAYVGYLLAEEDPDAVWRAIRLAGLPPDTAGLRNLALALAEWDRGISATRQQAPGALARSRGLPEVGRLEESWTRYVLNSEPNGVQQLLVDLLSEFRVAPRQVTKVAAELLARRAGLGSIDVTAARQPDRTEQLGQSEPGGGSARPQNYSSNPEMTRRLVAALNAAFRPEDVTDLLEYRLGIRLEAISLTSQIFQVVDWAVRNDSVTELVQSALDARPSSPELRAVATELGLTAETSPDNIATFLRASASIWEPNIWRSQLGRIEGRICRIEMSDAIVGTGFLVGSDLVLTAFAVMQPVIAGNVLPEQVKMRFDFRQALDGTVSGGTVYRLATEWLVNSSESYLGPDTPEHPEQLGYALLMVAGAPGNDAVGGGTVESNAAERGWLKLTRGMSVPDPGAALVTLDYALGGTLRLHYSLSAVKGYNKTGSYLRYRLESAPGSLGAPIFTANLNLVAMNQARSQHGERRGLMMTALVTHLVKSGLGRLVQAKEITATYSGALDPNGLTTATTPTPLVLAVLENAKQALRVNQLEMAQHLFEQVIDQATRSGDKAGEAHAYLGLAQTYYELGQPTTGLELLAKALVGFSALEDLEGVAATLNSTGMVHASLGEADRANEQYKQALAITREIGNHTGEAVILGNLASVYAAMGDFPRASAYCAQALVIVREVGDRSAEGTLLNRLGSAYIQLGEPRHGVEQFEQALLIAREIGDRVGEGTAYSGLGQAYIQLYEPENAIKQFEQALIVARELGDRSGEGIILGTIGNTNIQLGETNRAIEQLEQALVISREIGDGRNEAAISWNLGVLFEEQGDFVHASDLMQSALAYEQSVGHPSASAHADYVVDLERLRRNGYIAQQAATQLQQRLAESAVPYEVKALSEQLVAAQGQVVAVEQKLAAAMKVSSTSVEVEEPTSGVTRGGPSTGLRINMELMMVSVPTSIYHVLNPNDYPLVKCTVTTTAAFKRVRITSYIEGISTKAIDIVEIRRGQSQTTVVYQQPTLLAYEVRRINTVTRATVNVLGEDLDTGKIEIHRTMPVWLLPHTLFPITMYDPEAGARKDMSRFLGAFVTPNHPDVMHFLGKVSAKHSGVQHSNLQSSDDVDAYVEAVYEALKDEGGIVYDNLVTDFNTVTGVKSLRLRVPAETLHDQLASYLDASLLFVSLLEAISISSAIIVLPSLIMVGWEGTPLSSQWKYLDMTKLDTRRFAEAVEFGTTLAGVMSKQAMVTGNEEWYRAWPMRELRGTYGIYPIL